jgi:dihydrolipoamide dehydrogenase
LGEVGINMPRRVEALVIGAGSGGYVAAIRLGQLGKQVVLVEKERLGGECLNHACIPSKALISVARLIEHLNRAQEIGVKTDGLRLDFRQVQSWKKGIVDRLSSGVEFLCKKNNVEVIYGEAVFRSPKEVEVSSKSGSEIFSADKIVIAVGSKPIELPDFRFDRQLVLSSKEALELEEVPGRLLVIGGGVVGLEIGSMYAMLGSRVTIVEMTDQILPGIDPDLVQIVQRRLSKMEVTVHVKSSAIGFKPVNGTARVQIRTPQDEILVDVDRILLSVGRSPNTMAIERAGVELDKKGFIKVNEHLETSVPGIYAIGDITGPPLLAHKASHEGVLVAEEISGIEQGAATVIPEAIYTEPEIASVGLTERKAKELGYTTMAGRFPFSALGRAQAAKETEGFVKVVGDKSSGRLLGIQIVGPNASELVSEGALALKMGAKVEDLSTTVHPHPTLSEALMEAARNALGKAINIPNR